MKEWLSFFMVLARKLGLLLPTFGDHALPNAPTFLPHFVRIILTISIYNATK